MRLSPEACNDFPMAACLRRRMFQEPTPFLRRIRCELLGHRNCAVEVRELLRMSERQQKEGLVPGRFQSVIVAVRDTLGGKRERFRILCIRLRRVLVGRARELIETMMSASLGLGSRDQ